MIPTTLRISLNCAVIGYFIVILYFLKQRALNLKYTLLWLLAGVVMGALVASPQLLVKIIRVFGIQDNMNGLFIFCIGFVIMILLSLTSIVSRQNFKIRRLIQEASILDKRLRDMEEKLKQTQERLEQEKTDEKGK